VGRDRDQPIGTEKIRQLAQVIVRERVRVHALEDIIDIVIADDPELRQRDESRERDTQVRFEISIARNTAPALSDDQDPRTSFLSGDCRCR
jgi:hypothetical protein